MNYVMQGGTSVTHRCFLEDNSKKNQNRCNLNEYLS